MARKKHRKDYNGGKQGWVGGKWSDKSRAYRRNRRKHHPKDRTMVGL